MEIVIKNSRLLFLRYHWIIILLISPFLIFPSIDRIFILFVIPIIFLLTAFITKRPLPSTPYNLPFLLLFSMVLVSIFTTYNLNISLPKLTGIILGVSIFYSFFNLAIFRKNIIIPMIIYVFISLGISIFSLFGLRQTFKLSFLNSIIEKLPNVLISVPGAEDGFHPNEVAGALLWILPLFLSLFILFFTGGKRQKHSNIIENSLTSFFFLIALLTSGVVFLLAQSRTSFIALVISTLFLIVLFLPRKFRLPTSIVISIFLLFFVFFGWQSGWFQSLYTETSIVSGSYSIETLNGRVEIWSRAIYGIQDFPFTGMGMNTFRTILPVLYPLFTIPPEFDVGHAHNEFLQAALDLGIPGLIAFISIYFVSASMLIQIWQRSRHKRLSTQYTGLAAILHSRAGIKALVAGIAASLLAHALYGLTDAVALGAKPGILFWMLLALTAGLHHLVCVNESCDLNPVP